MSAFLAHYPFIAQHEAGCLFVAIVAGWLVIRRIARSS